MPASTLPVTEASSTPSAAKTIPEDSLPADKETAQQSESEIPKVAAPKPKISDLSTKDLPKNKLESEANSVAPISQAQTVSNQKEASVTSSAGVSGGGTSTVVSTVGAVPGTPGQDSMVSLSSLLPVNKVG